MRGAVVASKSPVPLTLMEGLLRPSSPENSRKQSRDTSPRHSRESGWVFSDGVNRSSSASHRCAPFARPLGTFSKLSGTSSKVSSTPNAQSPPGHSHPRCTSLFRPLAEAEKRKLPPRARLLLSNSPLPSVLLFHRCAGPLAPCSRAHRARGCPSMGSCRPPRLVAPLVGAGLAACIHCTYTVNTDTPARRCALTVETARQPGAGALGRYFEASRRPPREVRASMWHGAAPIDGKHLEPAPARQTLTP